jgi:hypothetical protein
MYVRLGGLLDTRIECWCKTCQAYITAKEVRVDMHAGHEFAPEDLAAIQAVRQYINSLEKKRAVGPGDSSV